MNITTLKLILILAIVGVYGIISYQLYDMTARLDGMTSQIEDIDTTLDAIEGALPSNQ